MQSATTVDKKVLIIDDEVDFCLLLKGYLSRKHFDVAIAHNLKEGLSFLASVKPDILFLDNNLPDGQGWQKAIDIVTQYPDTYLVMLSAFHPDAPQLPINSKYLVLEKPVNITELLGMLH